MGAGAGTGLGQGLLQGTRGSCRPAGPLAWGRRAHTALSEMGRLCLRGPADGALRQTRGPAAPVPSGSPEPLGWRGCVGPPTPAGLGPAAPRVPPRHTRGRIWGGAVSQQRQVPGALVLVRLGRGFYAFLLSTPRPPLPANRPRKGRVCGGRAHPERGGLAARVYLESSCPGCPGLSRGETPAGVRTLRYSPSPGGAGAERRPWGHRGHSIQNPTHAPHPCPPPTPPTYAPRPASRLAPHTLHGGWPRAPDHADASAPQGRAPPGRASGELLKPQTPRPGGSDFQERVSTPAGRPPASLTDPAAPAPHRGRTRQPSPRREDARSGSDRGFLWLGLPRLTHDGFSPSGVRNGALENPGELLPRLNAHRQKSGEGAENSPRGLAPRAPGNVGPGHGHLGAQACPPHRCLHVLRRARPGRHTFRRSRSGGGSLPPGTPTCQAPRAWNFLEVLNTTGARPRQALGPSQQQAARRRRPGARARRAPARTEAGGLHA